MTDPTPDELSRLYEIIDRLEKKLSILEDEVSHLKQSNKELLDDFRKGFDIDE